MCSYNGANKNYVNSSVMSIELETEDRYNTIQYNVPQLQNSIVTATIYVTDHKTVGGKP